MTNGIRMTNQFTDEQIEAGAKAYWLASEREIHDKPITWEWDKEERRRYMWAARQVLAGVAPQAPSVRESDKECPHTPRDEWRRRGYCHRCTVEAGWTLLSDQEARRELPVQPSSTVDEGKLAEVIAAHEMTSWGSRKWSGCECGEVYEVCPEGIVKWHANHRARAVVEAIGGESHAHD